MLKRFGTSGGGDGQFNYPWGLAIDSTKIYVTDSKNFRVQVFDKEGKYLYEFTTNSEGDENYTLPWAIAVDSSGKIYVTHGSYVKVFDNKGNLLFRIGKNHNNIIDYKGMFWNPRGIAVDQAGNIYVTDFNGPSNSDTVQVFDRNGTFLFGLGQQGFGDGQIGAPIGIAVSDGRVYVADNGPSVDYRIVVFDKHAIPEFPFAILVFIISIVSLIIFDRMKSRVQI